MTREILQLPLNMVQPNPNQPRRIFDKDALHDLAQSISIYGVLQPISVRAISHSHYELVAGERRLRASKLAGVDTIPAILVNINEEDSAVLAMLENLQRENLHFFEEAEGFQNLMNDFQFTQEAIAVRVGKNQSTIANKLRLLKLPKEVQNQILDSALTERHARALLKLTNATDQQAALDKIIKEGLTVRKTEDLIDSIIRSQDVKKGNTIPFKAYIRDIRILTNTIQENLEIVRRSGMEAEFDMEQTETGCSILITVNYANEGKVPRAAARAV